MALNIVLVATTRLAMRSRLFALFICGFALSLAACAAPPRVPIATVASDFRSNEIAAYAKYRGKVLHTSGVIDDLGVKGVERVSATHGSRGLFGSSRSTLHRRNVPHPFIYLVDPSVPGLKLLCYFKPEDMEGLAHVGRGMTVNVSGWFQERTDSSRGPLLVLNGCALE